MWRGARTIGSVEAFGTFACVAVDPVNTDTVVAIGGACAVVCVGGARAVDVGRVRQTKRAIFAFKPWMAFTRIFAFPVDIYAITIVTIDIDAVDATKVFYTRRF